MRPRRPKRQAVRTVFAPPAIGPYSQAIKTGALVFVSGQIAVDPETGRLVEGGIGPQTAKALENLRAVLEAGGLSCRHVAKTTVFLKDLAGFAQMNEVYARFFSDPPPARSTVEVLGLPKGALVEIEAIAVDE